MLKSIKISGVMKIIHNEHDIISKTFLSHYYIPVSKIQELRIHDTIELLLIIKEIFSNILYPH